MKYRHFFWDFDGTLYDTYGRITRATVNALHSLGAAASFDQVYPLVKRSLATCYQGYAAPLGIAHETFLEAYHAMSELEGPESIQPYPGAKETLEAVVAHGGYNYLYTHRGASAAKWLQYDGLEGLFIDGVTSRDGFPLKPAPDGALRIARELGIAPERTLYVGDSKMDMLCGGQAGMVTVGVTWGFRDREELIEHHAQYLIDRPEELPELINRWEVGGILF